MDVTSTTTSETYRIRSMLLRPVHLAAHAFYFAKNAQQVAPEDLLDVFSLVTAVEQRLRDLRQVGSGIDLLRQHRDAIEVGAEAHVLDAGDLGDVVDMVDQRLERRPGNLRGVFSRDLR